MNDAGGCRSYEENAVSCLLTWKTDTKDLQIKYVTNLFNFQELLTTCHVYCFTHFIKFRQSLRLKKKRKREDENPTISVRLHILIQHSSHGLNQWFRISVLKSISISGADEVEGEKHAFMMGFINIPYTGI